MQASEKQEMLALLAAGRHALLDAVDGIGEEQASRRPAAGGWSVLECVEHVALVEEYLLARLLEGRTAADTGINPAREGRIAKRAADRTRPVAAPEAVHPTGKYATVRDAVAAFFATRERTIRYLEACDEDLRGKVTTHPLIGTVNCQETLVMMAAHPKRHAEQIREMRGPEARAT
jgi:uncharacterized damage-inducible protein DinB